MGSPPEPSFDRLRALKGRVELAPGDLPLLVRFRDINDPTTVERVDPNDLAASFGPGVYAQAGDDRDHQGSGDDGHRRETALVSQTSGAAGWQQVQQQHEPRQQSWAWELQTEPMMKGAAQDCAEDD